MANNFNKTGYSTKEVAQILGCDYHTVMNWVNNGKIEALMSSDAITKGHRRTIRITRQQLKNFLFKNRIRYEDALISKFFTEEELSRLSNENANDFMDKKLEKEAVATGESIFEDMDSSWPPKGAYAANDIQSLNGAFKTVESPIQQPVKTPESSNIIVHGTHKAEPNRYSILIDGRICLGNLGRDTAKTVLDALLMDEKFSYSSITLKKGV